MDPEELEKLGNIEDLEDEDFDDSPKARGDFLEGEEDDEIPEVIDTDELEDESEEEADEEEVEEVEEVPDPPKEDPKANVRVPLSRLDAEIARRKELEEKLAKVGERDKQAERQTSRMGEISSRMEELDELMAKATLEGDDKQFRTLRAEERQLNNELMEMRLQASTQAAISQTRFDATLDLIESKYPQLNPDSDHFNQALTDEVTDLMEAFQAKGHAPHVALKRAVSYVIKEVEEVADVPEEKPKGLRAQTRSTETPKAQNRKAKQQIPPSTNTRRAATETEKSVWDMSDEEFDRWMDSKAAREARGDFLN